jgi:CcmD family protein
VSRIIKRVLCALSIALAITLVVPAASADVDPGTGTPELNFEAADPSAFKEDLSGIPFMVGAYMVIWLGLFGYLFLIHKRTQTVQGEIAQLRQALTEYDAK